jgi:hypothetical protein
MKKYTKVGNTTDGVPVYWGKKESDDPTSSNLTLWVTLGRPKADASNYRRVPMEDEVMYFKNQMNSEQWNIWMESIISTTDSSRIRFLWDPTQKEPVVPCHREPTLEEIKFGHGCTHFIEVPAQLVRNRKFIKVDGLRYTVSK